MRFGFIWIVDVVIATAFQCVQALLKEREWQYE